MTWLRKRGKEPEQEIPVSEEIAREISNLDRATANLKSLQARLERDKPAVAKPVQG